LLVKLKTVPH